MLYRSKMFQIGFKAGIVSTVILVGVVSTPAATAPANSSPAVAPLILSGRQSARPAGTFSPGVTEIIKMLDAKVETEVLLAFIQNSPIPYNPDAAELIALKEHGASTEILTSILHHGDELRVRLAQAESSNSPPPATPTYDYASATAPPAAYAPAPYPDSGGFAYPAGYYGYGYGYGYGYRAPWVCGSSTWNGCRPWYNHAPWWAKFYPEHHFANETPSTWSTAASQVKQPPFSGFSVASGSGSGRASSLALHSGGGHASGGSHVSGGGSAGRPAGRSR
jgi:hypothetical protein